MIRVPRFLALALLATVFGCGSGSDTGKATATTRDSPRAATTGDAPPSSKPAEPEVKELKVVEVTVGKGAKAAIGDTVNMTYTGKLTNGNVFDSNDKPDSKPIGFVLGQGVIEGWSKGIVGMRVGGERKLTIPPSLGYGAQANDTIPANSVLYFDVKMNALVKKGEPGVYDKPVDVKVGSGAGIKTGDSVTMDYTITFSNDAKLYSTQDDGKPETFTVGVEDKQTHTAKASGFTAAIMGMKPSGVRTFTLPPLIAYRPSPSIPPNEILKFKVSLISINKPSAPAKQ